MPDHRIVQLAAGSSASPHGLQSPRGFGSERHDLTKSCIGDVDSPGDLNGQHLEGPANLPEAENSRRTINDGTNPFCENSFSALLPRTNQEFPGSAQ